MYGSARKLEAILLKIVKAEIALAGSKFVKLF
jgi:hypothetical protein